MELAIAVIVLVVGLLLESGYGAARTVRVRSDRQR
jgi:hypothetical protein